MRSREEVLTEYNIERDEEDGCLILPQHRDTIINALADRIRELEPPPRPEPVAWVAPHNTLYLFDGYEFTIITRRPDGKLSVSGGDDMPENFDDEVGAAGIYRFVGSVHSAEGWTSEQCEAAGIPSDASNYSEWWNGHMEDATLADVAHVFGIPHPSVPPQRGDRGPADLAAAAIPKREVTLDDTTLHHPIVLHAVAWFLFTQLEFDPQQHDPRATTIPGERRVYYERLAHALMTTAQRARQAVPA